MVKKSSAPAGNRTRTSRVAVEDAHRRPDFFITFLIYFSSFEEKKWCRVQKVKYPAICVTCDDCEL